MNPPGREALLGQEESLTGTSYEVGRRNPALGEADLGMAAHVLVTDARIRVVHRVDVAHHLHSRGTPLDDEHGRGRS